MSLQEMEPYMLAAESDLLKGCTGTSFDFAAAQWDTASGILTSRSTTMATVVIGVCTLAAGLLLLAFGHALVRPVNFLAGAYLGGVGSLLAMRIFLPDVNACAAVIAVPVVGALTAGLVCAYLRKSMYFVFGLMAGDVVGSYLFFLAVEWTGLGSQGLYFSMGFFAFTVPLTQITR